MAKSAEAFRTIREVADWLDVPAHVLRFWESKFTQIKPVKRAGGRRYYRPSDMMLVGGIKVLLHERGMTIRGVQKMLSDNGLEAVTSLAPPINDMLIDGLVEPVESTAVDVWEEDAAADATAGDTATGSDHAEQIHPQDAPAPETAPPELHPTAEPVDESPATDPLEQTPPEPTAEEQATPEPERAPDTQMPEPAPAETPVETPEETQLAPSEIAPPQDPPPPTYLRPTPGEGRLGALAAIAELPVETRARIAPQIAALARLRAAMTSSQTPPHDHS